MNNSVVGMKNLGLFCYFWGFVLNIGAAYVFLLVGGSYGVFGTSEGLLFMAMAIFLLVIMILVIYKKFNYPLLFYGTPIVIVLLILHEFYKGELTLSTITIIFLGFGRFSDYRASK